MSKIIQFHRDKARLKRLSEKYYDEGNYLSALHFLYEEQDETGANADLYIRMADVYEHMGLYGSAVNVLFHALDICSADGDLPDIYEGLGANFMHLGIENQSAYYYNRLIDADDTLTDENKYEIAQAFAKDKRDNFRFVYPPALADYAQEMDDASKLLKQGETKRAAYLYSLIPEGNEDYVEARQLQAVAHLLDGDTETAEKLCLDLLQKYPDDAQTLATLSAVYLEQDRTEESKALALRLCELTGQPTDAAYKIATVCCENGMHDKAYEKFHELEKEMPYDARLLYFQSVAAYKSGNLSAAEQGLSKICALYPDAAVARYYLKALRAYRTGNADTLPEFTYFYRIPQEERELRCRTLLHIGKYSSEEAESLALLAQRDDYFVWCFDEMDGMDKDLQYVALVVAEHARLDGFLQDVLLDYEVGDALKVELLRLLYQRNDEEEWGMVLCNIYKRHTFTPVKLGRKKRRLFLEAYAKTASRFALFNPVYAKKIKRTTETVYEKMRLNGGLDEMKDADALSAVFYLLAGIKDMGATAEEIAALFETQPAKIYDVLSVYDRFPQSDQGEK